MKHDFLANGSFMLCAVPADAPALPAYPMKKMAAATVEAETNSGVFSRAKKQPVQVGAYSIGEAPVTYELWYAVRQWAESSGGYKFSNKGREGSKGKDGAEPGADKGHPATYMSWRDAVIWCNAYSEALGRTPAYYEDAGLTKVLKTSQGQEAAVGEGIADNLSEKADADGFRLPTE
ncbi:MAG: SUMF1/EgtB/PvdO family nonheme iron enzyme, partial [Methanomassiliicoccaceae archaeon]|nr:SUMF1/EgtB/PvdO family nonheme iron enzyme [Methanomassiliicoccaceae archaeon]